MRATMENQIVSKLITDLEALNNEIGDKNAKKLHIELLERVTNRLGTFSVDCLVCEKHLFELNDQIEKLKNKHGQFEKVEFTEHQLMENKITSHLKKEHKLIPEGFYMSIYMSIGMSLGVVFGLLIFDNIALGLPLGLSFGLAIGVGLDADAKKKGLTL
jgi:predicted nuclease with TOPRIM domain